VNEKRQQTIAKKIFHFLFQYPNPQINFFLNARFENFTHRFAHMALLVVGPSTPLWKVLRETEGEQFVPHGKVFVFNENLHAQKNQSRRIDLFGVLRMCFMRSGILSQESCLQTKTRTTERVWTKIFRP
jgi:hypothetical protein